MPHVGQAELAEVSDAFRENRLTMGARVARFEHAMAERIGVAHAIAVSNGTVALDLALKVLEIGPGDEVMVPAMSYIATLAAVLYQSATPVFVDIERSTLNMDPSDLARKLTPRTRCIMPIDYGGNPADHHAIRAIADAHGVPILLDGAQSLGGSYRGAPLNSFGHVSTVSFHAAKVITTIEGGMVFTGDDAVARQLRVLRNQGEDPARKYFHIALGSNARMTDIAAAVGLAQLPELDGFLRRRAELAAYYTERLAGHPGIRLPATRASDPQAAARDSNAWMFYPVLVEERDRVADELRTAGVDTRICYPLPLYEQPVFAKYATADGAPYACPVAEAVTRRVLNLPMFHTLSTEMQDHVCDTLIPCVERSRQPSLDDTF